MSHLLRFPLIVVDTETTGLLDDPDASPWEIAAVALDLDGVEIDTLSVMGRPCPWREDMRRIVAFGGIDPDDVLVAPPLAERLPEVHGWLNRHLDAGARLTAFNSAFDAPMLQRAGVKLQGREWAPCIMERAKREMGRAGALPWMSRWQDWKMPRLADEAAPYYGVEAQQPVHRALADARTAALVAVEIQRRALAPRS